MRRIKAWAQLTGGALVFALGFISIVNFSFDWEFIMPPSVILAGVLVLVGGVVFANGLLGLEPPLNTSTGECERQKTSGKK